MVCAAISVGCGLVLDGSEGAEGAEELLRSVDNEESLVLVRVLREPERSTVVEGAALRVVWLVDNGSDDEVM